MAKTKISEFSATPGNNTDIDGINIAEGCAPSGINDAIRELMSQLKDFQAGTAGDSFNGPVGTTTAAAGAFTTLSSTGNTTLGDAAGDTVTVNGTATFANANPTLSAGTANGVAYLNGSKVLTTGSALTFDGTNLGIGTSSPVYKLDVQGGRTLATANSETYSIGVRNRVSLAPNGNYWIGATNAVSPDMVFSNNAGTETMRLTDAGNLGLGVTPSAWQSGRVAFQIQRASAGGGVSIHTAATSQAIFAANTYYNGTNDIYTSSGAASSYVQFNGAHSWYSAASGTAGNAISFTQAMTLDSSGNLLVGTTAYSNYLAGVYIRKSNASNGEIGVVGANGTDALYGGYRSDTAGVTYRVQGNGNVQNANNSYGAISDAKLKENIIDATPKLEKLNQVRVVNYNLIGDTQKQIGVIAQELEQIFPGMIEETPDRDPEGNNLGTTTKTVKYSVFVPMLIKAIQEQQAIIEQLKADVAALKG